jgi:hypothetical protein
LILIAHNSVQLSFPRQGGDLRNHVAYLWKEPHVPRQYRTAISLHGHTNLSKESLYFIPEYADRHTLLRWALSLQEKRCRQSTGIRPDFWSAYWTPPLPPLAAYALEMRQIEGTLDLAGLVSITDHDDITAPMLLRVVPQGRTIPIAFEWSIPFEGTIFHVGVHNLPPAEANGGFERLRGFTINPKPNQLRDLVSDLARIPGVLLVLNHPLWDLPGIGQQNHNQALFSLLHKIGASLHALELNGLRDWKENQAVVELAVGWNLPIISGGDRHGCEPGAMLNLTAAADFSEFAEEIRKDKHSIVLVMPQYTEPLTLRWMQTMLDVIRTYPDYPLGSQKWDERAFHPDQTGVARPLSTLWEKPPAFIESVFSILRLAESEPVRRAARYRTGRAQAEFSFSLKRGWEVAP